MNTVHTAALLSALMTFPVSTGCAPGIGDVASVDRAATADQWVTSRVKNALIAEHGVSGSSIEVDSRSGHVTLAGSVRSHEERRKAIEVARAVNGVTEVTADLAVENEG